MIFALFLFLLSLALFPAPAHAVCPVCTIAVAGGLGLSRLLGIDDTVTSLWIGGLIISSGLWLASWLSQKSWKIPHKEILSVALFFLLVIPPLFWAKMIGASGNTLWGIDKVLLGTLLGMTLFLGGYFLDKYLRQKNGGLVFIYYQKVILPVLALSLGSFVFYLITL